MEENFRGFPPQIVATSRNLQSTHRMFPLYNIEANLRAFQNHKFVFFIRKFCFQSESAKKRQHSGGRKVPSGMNIINLFHFRAFVASVHTRAQMSKRFSY